MSKIREIAEKHCAFHGKGLRPGTAHCSCAHSEAALRVLLERVATQFDGEPGDFELWQHGEIGKAIRAFGEGESISICSAHHERKRGCPQCYPPTMGL